MASETREDLSAMEVGPRPMHDHRILASMPNSLWVSVFYGKLSHAGEYSLLQDVEHLHQYAKNQLAMVPEFKLVTDSSMSPKKLAATP